MIIMQSLEHHCAVLLKRSEFVFLYLLKCTLVQY